MTKVSMKKKLLVLLTLVIVALAFTGFNMYRRSPKAALRTFFKATLNRDINKYNAVVIEKDKKDSLDSSPDVLKDIKITKISEIKDYTKYPFLVSDVSKLAPSERENVEFYLIEEDIKFKDNVATPIDSAKYLYVYMLVKSNNKWLVNTNCHKAYMENNNLIIGS